MRNFKVVLVFVLISSLLGLMYLIKPSRTIVALNVPTPTATSTNTPPPPPTTPPPDPTTPAPSTITPTSTNTPMDDPLETPPPPEESPVATPSVIPALGTGPRIDSIILYGTLLLVLFGVVTGGWMKVWQAYRQQKL